MKQQKSVDLDHAHQLSACRLSLLLGVGSENDSIHCFLNFSRKLLGCTQSLLSFHQEPYVWLSSGQQIEVLEYPIAVEPSRFNLQSECLIDHHHIHGKIYQYFLQQIGIYASHFVVVLLKTIDQTFVGFAIFYDQTPRDFTVHQKEMLLEYSKCFSQQIELKFNYDQLNELYEQQVVMNQSKNKFFSIISHDLRAPFHGLLGFSEVLAKERHDLDESSIQNIADYLYDTSQSTYNLLESLLTWSMAEGGHFVYHPINFSLRHVSNIVFDVLNALAIKKNIQLINHITHDLQVYADINMMTSVIQNLVSNAVKFTDVHGHGKVILEAKRLEHGIEVSVRDNGLGMTEQQLHNLFQPRHTLSFKGTAGERGAGLGLSLCKKFVEMNHGHIEVSSKEGEGSIFRVVLPPAHEHHVGLPHHSQVNI